MHEITNLKNIVSNAEAYNEELEVSLSPKLAWSKICMEHGLVFLSGTDDSDLAGLWLVLPVMR